MLLHSYNKSTLLSVSLYVSMFLPTVVHLQPTCSISRYDVPTFLRTLVSSNLIYLALSAKRFSVLKLKYSHNLLVFSCRHFSVRELSAVSVLSFSLPLQRSYNVSLVFPTFLRTITCSYKVNFGHDKRNGKERRK